MFDAFYGKKLKGDKLMGNIMKMTYTQSVGDNSVLSLMLQMKLAGTLKVTKFQSLLDYTRWLTEL
jgi:hypothetical protein